MERKQKIIVAVAAVLVLMVGLWHGKNLKQSFQADTRRINLRNTFICSRKNLFLKTDIAISEVLPAPMNIKMERSIFIGVMRYGRASNARSMEIKL